MHDFSHDPVSGIRAELKKAEEAENSTLCGMLKIQNGNKWLIDGEALGEARKLYYEFWFEHEICLFFGDTGCGKSILAVQIAKELSDKGQKVLLLDFELSARQFFKRFSGISFSENFLRAEMDSNALPSENFEIALIENIKQGIRKHEAKILIIDNITFLRTETEKAKDALTLMKILKELTRKLSISTLILGHTPKRDERRPITNNDLAGSKMLINFVDSAFAIGKSAFDTGLRYLKQIKVRSDEVRYDGSNVLTMELMNDNSFLRFEFKHFDSECVHLKETQESDTKKRNEEIISLAHQGYSHREIAVKYNISHTQVRRILIKANK